MPMPMPAPVLVVMTGAPGAGKSTLGVALASQLGSAFLSFDTIKEALADTLGVGDETWSRALGDASDEIFFGVIPGLGSTVLDHWWRDPRGERLAGLGRPVVEVFCRCADDELIRRGRERVALGTRHPVHRDWMPADPIAHLRTFRSALEPLALGGPVLDVDTTNPVDVVAVAARVGAELDRSADLR